MKIPVVLPTVQVKVADDGTLTVDVDGEPHRTDHALRRGDLRSMLDEITAELKSAVRVEVEEADGTTYADIATPSETPSDPNDPGEPRPTTGTPAPGINGNGFLPGEEVAIAYVLAHLTADDDGMAALQLPPALLPSRRQGLVLLGLTSQVIATVD